MRVLLAAVANAHQPSGVCRHAANLARCLLSRAEVSKIKVVVGVWAQPYFRNLIDSLDERLEITVADANNNAWARNRWYYRELPHVAKHLDADVVHATYPTPLHRARFSSPVVVTLHDLYPYSIPENFGYPRVLVNRVILQHSLRAADAVACVSQSTLDEFGNRWPALRQKAFRVYNSVEEHAAAPSAPLPELTRSPFLLAVAQHRRNKNLPLSLRVFQRLRQAGGHPGLKLLIVGNDGPETPCLLSLMRALDLMEHVITMNGLSEGELQWCYRHCELLLSTSTIEGFGLPIAEARMAGCRIVCSDLPVFREAGGDFCSFVPLGSNEISAFTDGVIAALAGKKVPPLTLSQFSKDAIAADYVRLYQRLISSHDAERARVKSQALEPLLPKGHLQ